MKNPLTKDTLKAGDKVKHRFRISKYQDLTVTEVEKGCNGVIHVVDNSDGESTFFPIQDLTYQPMKAVSQKVKFSFPSSAKSSRPNEWRYGELTEEQVLLINAKLSTMTSPSVVVAFATEDDIDGAKVKPVFVDVQPAGPEPKVILEAMRSARRMGYRINMTKALFLKED